MIANRNKELLKSFVIGSSLPAFVILFLAVIYFLQIEKTGLINYYRYSILAPLWLGSFSLVAKFISIKYNIKLNITYFIFSLVSAIAVSIWISYVKTYNFKTKERGYVQYLLIFIGHLFIYNKIIYPLDIYFGHR